MTETMLAITGSEEDLDLPGFWADEKYDGTRVVIKVEKEVKIFSRNEKEYTNKYPELVEEIKNIYGIWDGELTFFDKKTGKEEFQTVQATEETKNSLDWCFIVFDAIHLKDLKYSERRTILENIFREGTKHIRLSRISKTNHKKFYDEIIKSKGEGVILKKIDSKYQEGERSKDWIKIKRLETNDVEVIGWTEGTGRRKEWFGALIIKDNEGREANVGGGYSDEMLSHIKKHYLIADGKVLPLKIEIAFLNKTKVSYRMPRFIRIRDDK